MTEHITMIVFILFVIGGLYLAFRIAAWKMKKAGDFIIGDLKKKKAFEPASAVELSYAKRPMMSMGLRDYRPAALQELIKLDVIRMQDGGRYYLREGHEPAGPDDRTAA